MIGLLAVALAAAAPLEVAEPVPLPAAVDELVALPLRDGAQLLGLSDEATWVLSAEGASMGTRAAAHAAAVVDLDGDGARELLLCTDDGLLAGPWEAVYAEHVVADEPCTAVAVVHADETLVVTGAEGAQRLWGLDGSGLEDRGALGDPGEEVTRTAVDGDRLALASGSTVTEWSPEGRRTWTAGGAIEGVAVGADGWAWSAGGALHGTDAAVSAFPGAGAIASARLSAEDRQLVVAHPGPSLVGVLDGDTERALHVGVSPLLLATGDLDGDRLDEIAVSDGRALVVLHSTAPPPPRMGPDDLRRSALGGAHRLPTPNEFDVPMAGAWGLAIPRFSGTGGHLASGRVPPEILLVGGIGASAGGALEPGRAALGSIALAAVMEHGRGTRPFRPFYGIDSSPLFRDFADTVVTHVALASVGLTLGGPHLRTGPYVTGGFLAAGVGMRTVWTPLETRSGTLHGFELRLLGLMGPDINGQWQAFGEAPVGEVALLYVNGLPLGASSGRFDPRMPAAAPEGSGGCRRFAVSTGFAGGVSSTTSAWEFVGSTATWDTSWSPALTMACETGKRSAGVVFGASTAPFYGYRIPFEGLAADDRVLHLGAAQLGAVFGGDTVRAGPFAQGGVWSLGGGARVVVTPVVARGGARHGLELRAVGLVPSAPSWEGWAMYTAWWDPRR